MVLNCEAVARDCNLTEAALLHAAIVKPASCPRYVSVTCNFRKLVYSIWIALSYCVATGAGIMVSLDKIWGGEPLGSFQISGALIFMEPKK